MARVSKQRSEHALCSTNCCSPPPQACRIQRAALAWAPIQQNCRPIAIVHALARQGQYPSTALRCTRGPWAASRPTEGAVLRGKQQPTRSHPSSLRERVAAVRGAGVTPAGSSSTGPSATACRGRAACPAGWDLAWMLRSCWRQGARHAPATPTRRCCCRRTQVAARAAGGHDGGAAAAAGAAGAISWRA